MDEERARYERMLRVDGPTVNLVVERETIQPGRSFSADAMTALNNDMITWVGTRLMRRWERTGEPPTRLSVTLTVEVG